MVKILLLGANGQVGRDLQATCPADYKVIPFTRQDLDLENLEAIKKKMDSLNVQGIINTAAYHRSGECEAHPHKAFLLNCLLPRELARLAKKKKIFLAHFSTNFVFKGEKKEAYTEEDQPEPISTYGITRYLGELYIQALHSQYYIFRVSCLFGKWGNKKGRENFVYKTLKAAQNQEEWEMIEDAITSPTYTIDLAKAVWKIIQNQEKYGVYHLANSGMASWYELGVAIAQFAGYPLKAKPVKQERFFGPLAKRPLFTPLASVQNVQLRPWQESLKEFVFTLIKGEDPL